MIDKSSQRLYIARHGETEWSLNGRHTGLTDLPLTYAGERDARRLGERLQRISHERVFSSPLLRARRTCELAGCGGNAVMSPDLLEWNYGAYEGLRTTEIAALRPHWDLFTDGCPGGEMPEDVASRADRFVEQIRSAGSSAVIFSSGHISRVLAVRWLGLPVAVGAKLQLSTSSFSILGYGHGDADPVICLWNDLSHLSF